MKKPDKKLFEHATASSENGREYHFMNLLGEPMVYHLSWEEYLRNVKCKICGNYFVQGHGYMDSWFFCPSCKSENGHKTLEEYKKEVEENLLKNNERLQELNDAIDREQRIIEILENRINKK